MSRANHSPPLTFILGRKKIWQDVSHPEDGQVIRKPLGMETGLFHLNSLWSTFTLSIFPDNRFYCNLPHDKVTFDQNQLTFNFSPRLVPDKILEALSEELDKISMIIMTLR